MCVCVCFCADNCLSSITGPPPCCENAGQASSLLHEQYGSEYNIRLGRAEKVNWAHKSRIIHQLNERFHWNVFTDMQNCLDVLPEETIHFSPAYSWTLAARRFIPAVSGNLAELHTTVAVHHKRREKQWWRKIRWKPLANVYCRKSPLLHAVLSESDSEIPPCRVVVHQNLPDAVQNLQSMNNEAVNPYESDLDKWTIANIEMAIIYCRSIHKRTWKRWSKQPRTRWMTAFRHPRAAVPHR